MATDRKVKRVELDACSAISPHLGIDARFVFFKCLGINFGDAFLFGIAQVELGRHFRIQQRHAGVVAGNDRITEQRLPKVSQQRLDNEVTADQDVKHRAARRRPALPANMSCSRYSGK